MLQRNTRTRMWLAGFLALAVVAGACGGGDDSNATSDPSAQTGEVADGELTGTINVSGSSTVAPITTRVAEKFQEQAPDVVVNVDGPGTGDGFKLFCEGETDISDASRAIKAEEAEDCAANDIEFIELKVAIDGLTVMTNPDNEAVECLSFPDLYALAGPESQGFDNWRDAQAIARALGSDTRFPDLPLDMVGPGEESGTYDSFIELALAGPAEERVEAGELDGSEAEVTRPDYQSSGDDNVIIQGITGSRGSFGWVGFAYAEENSGQVKEIAVSGEANGECVEPTPETIASGQYPLSRPLFIYVNAERVAGSPALAAFVDYYLGDGISSVPEVGYVALEPAALNETVEAWEQRTTGTREG